MTLNETAERLGFEMLQKSFTDRPLRGAYTSDLLSDVMAHAHERDLLITIQAHKNTVAVATLVGVAAIVLCNDRPVPEDMIQAARDEEIGIFRTDKDQFTVSGEIYRIVAPE